MLVILEGLDRTYKSTLAELLRKRGFKVVHMSAPDKKYSKPGYTGPSYLDDLVDLFMKFVGENVVLDRSHVGELVWSQVYGRQPQLTHEDIQILREMEEIDGVVRILMHDPDENAHWQRCVENNEPLSLQQFKVARVLFDDVAEKYGFIKATKADVDSGRIWGMMGMEGESNEREVGVVRATNNDGEVGDSAPVSAGEVQADDRCFLRKQCLTPEQRKLLEANAINDILSARIIKRKGEHFDVIETKLRSFLNQELAKLLGMAPGVSASGVETLTADEVMFIRLLMKKTKGTRDGTTTKEHR